MELRIGKDKNIEVYYSESECYKLNDSIVSCLNITYCDWYNILKKHGARHFQYDMYNFYNIEDAQRAIEEVEALIMLNKLTE